MGLNSQQPLGLIRQVESPAVGEGGVTRFFVCNFTSDRVNITTLGMVKA